MNAVKTPWWVMVTTVLVPFAAMLYGLRQYASIGGPGDLTLAAGAGLICLIFVFGLIWANYETYPPRIDRGQPRHRIV